MTNNMRKIKEKVKMEFKFKWYDLWIGAYIDVSNNTIYICPIPMIVIKIKVTK